MIINNEIIKYWESTLSGMAKWSKDEQDVKTADKYFACLKLLTILKDIIKILHKELD